MTLQTETVDLRDEAERIRHEIEDVKEEYRELQEEVEGMDGDESDEDGDKADELYSEGVTLEARFERLQGRLSALQTLIDEWDGTQFVIEEPTFGEVMRARDQVSSNQKAQDGFYRIKMLELTLTQVPEDAPDEPKDYPRQLGELLFEKVDNLSTFGDADTGNLSLSEAVEKEDEEREKNHSQTSSAPTSSGGA